MAFRRGLKELGRNVPLPTTGEGERAFTTYKNYLVHIDSSFRGVHGVRGSLIFGLVLGVQKKLRSNQRRIAIFYGARALFLGAGQQFALAVLSAWVEDRKLFPAPWSVYMDGGPRRAAMGLHGLPTHAAPCGSVHAIASPRHFGATQMLASGVLVGTVSGRLGHADAASRLNICGHWVQASDQAAATILGDLLGSQDHLAGRRPNERW